MSGVHSRLSPSGADSWMVCFGYPNAVEGLPNDDSEYSAEGTAAHTISEACLALGLEPHFFIGSRVKIGPWTFEWDDEDADYLQPGIDQFRDLPGVFYGEHKVDLSRWLGPKQSGTLDRGKVSRDLIALGDLKYGRGVPVSPVRNKQMMLYALGFWENIARHISKATEFLLIVDQPRCNGGGGEWRTTLDELLVFGEEAREAAQRTLDPDAPRVASEKGCKFCRRKNAPGGCDAYDRFNLDLIGMQFGEVDEAIAMGSKPPITIEMSPERRSWILEHKSMIEQWLEQLHTNCLDDAIQGRPTPGVKAVAGRKGARRYTDASAADPILELLLGANRFTKKLKSPTQIEKEISKADYAEKIAPLVTQSAAKPILVPVGDARPALTPVDAKFDEVSDTKE